MNRQTNYQPSRGPGSIYDTSPAVDFFCMTGNHRGPWLVIKCNEDTPDVEYDTVKCASCGMLDVDPHDEALHPPMGCIEAAHDAADHAHEGDEDEGGEDD